ncbi:MAG TPA: methionyl-tRNA formyltransferase [Candidatus Omnitrophota bacterium]|nr:methionyl-tRNA formyltransferase [Candidatus Omnitrophota bacterium]HRZ15187.1 methionyl-tRNA formyltransferase [Candidatus Omnitrophota bacterium]
MKIVFLGSAHYAEPSLRLMIKEGFDVCCVVTQEDKRKDRHLHLQPTVIKQAAIELGVPVFQPADINAPDAIAYLRKLDADLFVLIAYGQKLSQKVLDIPHSMTINIHGSMLPSYRGAAPIQWALMHGEKETGNSLIKVILEMDAGPVLLQKPRAIQGTDTFLDLEKQLSLDAACLLLEGLALIQKNQYHLTEQDGRKVSYAPRLTKKHGLIDWAQPAQHIVNLVRGAQPWPGAFTHFRGKLIKVHQAVLAAAPADAGTDCAPGQVLRVSKEGIEVAAGQGVVKLLELQAEAGRRMSVSEFIAGHKVCAGERFQS